MPHGDIDSVIWSVIAMHDPLTVSGVIRKLWVTEEHLYRDHLLRLDDAGRRERFGGAVTDAGIVAEAAAVFRAGAIVHGFFVDGQVRGAGDLRLVTDGGDCEGDAAFSVEAAYRDAGVGSALLGRTLLAARKRGARRLRTAGLPATAPMQALAHRLDGGLSDLVGPSAGDTQPAGQSSATLWRDLLQDSRGIAAALLDAQVRALRPGPA